MFKDYIKTHTQNKQNAKTKRRDQKNISQNIKNKKLIKIIKKNIKQYLVVQWKQKNIAFLKKRKYGH